MIVCVCVCFECMCVSKVCLIVYMCYTGFLFVPGECVSQSLCVFVLLLQIVLPNTVCDSSAKTKLYQLLLDHFD